MEISESLARKARQLSSNVDYLTRESHVVDNFPVAASLSGPFKEQELVAGRNYLSKELLSLEEKARALSLQSAASDDQAGEKRGHFSLAELFPAAPAAEELTCCHLALQQHLIRTVQETDECLRVLRFLLADARVSVAREQELLDDARVLHASLQEKVQHRHTSRNLDASNRENHSRRGLTPTQVMEAHASRLERANEELMAQLASFVDKNCAKLNGDSSDVTGGGVEEDGRLQLTDGHEGADSSPPRLRKLPRQSANKATPRHPHAQGKEPTSPVAAPKRQGLVQLITELITACFDSETPAVTNGGRPGGIPRSRYKQAHVELLLRAGVASALPDDPGKIHLTRYHE
eukprot:jgi/Mesvir1/4266/Mv22227-RA.1